MGKVRPLEIPIGVACSGKVYDLARIEFHYGYDGSLYFFFAGGRGLPRKTLVSRFGTEAEETISRPFKLSYHASGQINFEGPSCPPIFAEPLAHLTLPQLLVYQQIPQLGRLPPRSAPIDPANIIQFEDNAPCPIGIEIWMTPFVPFAPSPQLLLACAFEDLFRLQFLRTPPAFGEERFRHLFVRSFPQRGNRDSLAIDRDTAAAAFHLRSSKSTDSVLPLGEGRYRYYFFPAMHRPPRTRIVWKADHVECAIEHVTPYLIQFRLTNCLGGIDTDEPMQLVGFSLDAEL